MQGVLMDITYNSDVKKIIPHIEWFLSLLLLAATIYQSVIGERLFLLVSLIFLSETAIYVLAVFNKTLKIASLIQFLHSPLVMVVLLVSVLLNGAQSYSLLLIIVTICHVLCQGGLSVFYLMDDKNSGDLQSYIKKYNAFLSLIYGINLLVVLLSRNLANESNAAILLLIIIVINALSTFAVAYFALAFLISAYANKAMSFKEKIQAVTRFFIRYELGFMIGEVFCFITMIVSFVNIRVNVFFFYLGLFYSIIFTARLITFLWNKRLEKAETDPFTLSKKKHGILLFNAIFFLATGDILTVASLLLSVAKASSNIPAWFFVGFMFPFSILSFVLSMVHRKSAKSIDNAYLDVTVDQSLITSLFSFLAGLSYFFKYIPNENAAGHYG